MAIEYVMSYLKTKQDILPINIYIGNLTTSSWLSRIYDTVIKTPVRWSKSTIINNPTASSTLYVCIPSIQTISEFILQQYRNEKSYFSCVNRILTFTEFRAKYGKYDIISLTEGDIWLLLKYMNSHFGVRLAPDVRGYGKSHLVIKLPEYNENNFTFKHIPDEITENDKAIISLKTTCKALNDQVTELQTKMEELLQSCLDHSNKKQKLQALYALKRKKQLEEILDRRLKSLDTIETILLKIDASHNDIQVMQAFNVGADALKHILSDSNITVTSVDETILKMQNALEDQKRIEDAITFGMEQTIHVNDDDNIHNEIKIEYKDENKNENQNSILKEKRHWEEIDNQDIKNISEARPIQTTNVLQSNSELARLHSILSDLPEVPIKPLPKSKQRRREKQLA
ncbi:unnamed protein product [Cunninghamella blakesleeana]